MKKRPFTGTITALVTPFRKQAVAYDDLAKLVEAQIKGGIDGLVPVGTTGESPTLDHDEHIEVIRHLDPKPGSRFNPAPSQYVMPDVYIVKVEDQYVAVLNDDGLPQLRISPVYKRLLDNKHDESAAETRAYVKEKFRSALWLLKSVDQRQKTIIKVANSIIQFQREFLDHGIERCIEHAPVEILDAHVQCHRRHRSIAHRKRTDEQHMVYQAGEEAAVQVVAAVGELDPRLDAAARLAPIILHPHRQGRVDVGEARQPAAAP